MCLCLPNHLYKIESLRFTYFAKILFKFDANIHAVQFTPIFWAANCIPKYSRLKIYWEKKIIPALHPVQLHHSRGSDVKNHSRLSVIVTHVLAVIKLIRTKPSSIKMNDWWICKLEVLTTPAQYFAAKLQCMSFMSLYLSALFILCTICTSY